MLAVVYVWRLVEIVYLSEPEAEFEGGDAPWRLLVPTWIFAGATIYFGIFSDFSVEIAGRAALQLFGSGM